jgi:CheY-like chemotaxis protein
MHSTFSSRKVLLAEDEMLVAWLFVDMLDDLGRAIVGPASSVDQALAMIDTEAIDVAVLDVNLNGQMSYPIAEALAGRGVPFIFSTGYGKDSCWIITELFRYCRSQFNGRNSAPHWRSY